MEGIYPNSVYSSSNSTNSYMISSPDFRSSSLSESSHNRPYDNATQDDHRQHETPSSLGLSWNSSSPLPPPSRPQAVGYHNYNTSFTMPPPQRPKLTTTVWEDEGTICYQVDAKSVCVARRQDNDMINGTKLLNVVGMSRGKRDGILKNEKGRVVVKVGAMHLKGVWITFSRAKDLATKFRIFDILYPLFVEDPSIFLSIPPPPSSSSTTAPTNTNLPFMLPSKGYYKNDYQLQQWGKPPQQHYLPSINQEMTMRALSPTENHNHHHHHDNHNPENGSMYLINHPHDYRLNRNQPPYHVHDNPSHFTPVYQRRSLMDGKEEPEEQRQIGFPSSPPPEVKYYNNNNNNTFGPPSSSSSSSHPEEQGKNSRKRASTIMNNNPKRIRSDKEFY